jgi:hypothetical protein
MFLLWRLINQAMLLHVGAFQSRDRENLVKCALVRMVRILLVKLSLIFCSFQEEALPVKLPVWEKDES